ncbi:MAG: hypothetical protein KDA57_19735, partial [Planctomycetales bacterium]|nr:hypothetical protein [Planctomycetales bacterium]
MGAARKDFDSIEHSESLTADGAEWANEIESQPNSTTRNSTPPKQTQTPEFKRWFGNSKVVD